MDEPTYLTRGQVEPLFSTATEEDFSFLEDAVSHSLPDSYRRFLLQNNGLYIPGGVQFALAQDFRTEAGRGFTPL